MMISTSDRISTLRSLIRLLTDASEIVISEWEAADARGTDGHTKDNVPSRELYDAQRIFIGACGMCLDIVDEPLNRILDINYAIVAARSLFLAVQTNIPDILDAATASGGVSVSELSRQIGARETDLARMLRLLSSKNIFTEVRQDHFINGHIGQVLVKNKPAQCMVLLPGIDELFRSIQHLPAAALDTSSTRSAFQKAIGADLGYFEYFAQGIKHDDGSVSRHPVLDVFPMAMAGFNQGCSPALIADFPWASLGSGAATIVDVGGGVGSMSLDLAKAFPHLRFVVQDLPDTIEQAKVVWQTGCPEAVRTGRVQLLAHDFFAEQPVKGADAYLLRYLLHDWPEDQCVAILSRLREAMNPESRILVAEMIIHPTSGSSLLKSAPKPLPANYGYAHFGKDTMDVVMLALFSGMERTPEQFARIAGRAGLAIKNIWECRGPAGIVEMCAATVSKM
ncbi:S-adenosyl-L-methionine-dependent methyltransferase [Daedalea quercina L-15889]|uniref:S-adenosyl-L-methionine-dependent methyltransferase n=1 Tax=Daedalea quercina L-15889 TaxID=1314783 RepID=A0A165Q371_9APHY|nr:S-adenosyl-L-methionine-dependent methyltransferase [Daedalea quercina L-15889]